MKFFAKIVLGAFICFMPWFAGAAEQTATGDSTVTVQMQTNKGTIVLELDAEKAPGTVANFVEYAKAGFYDGTIFHRVIPGFMIQGGGFEPGMDQKKTREPIQNEADNGLKNDLGTIAMARTPNPHSATAQFFINVKDNGFLNQSGNRWGYAVFGRVDEGMDVVDAVRNAVETRLRPIAMSTLTTVFGLAPLVLLPGAGTELYRGVGAIVMFGVMGTAVVALTFLPALTIMVLTWSQRSSSRSLSNASARWITSWPRPRHSPRCTWPWITRALANGWERRSPAIW